MMKWVAYNAFGGSAWLAGLFVAKTGTVPGDAIPVPTDYSLLTGFVIGMMGLAVLVWSNVLAAD